MLCRGLCRNHTTAVGGYCGSAIDYANETACAHCGLLVNDACVVWASVAYATQAPFHSACVREYVAGAPHPGATTE